MNFGIITIFIPVGLLDVARMTYTEVVDDVSGKIKF